MKSINYQDLIPGNIYKGVVVGCTSKPTWIFQYTPPKEEIKDADGNKVCHEGICYEMKPKKLKNDRLWQFENGWEFSEATEEQKALLQLKYEYEIY